MSAARDQHGRCSRGSYIGTWLKNKIHDWRPFSEKKIFALLQTGVTHHNSPWDIHLVLPSTSLGILVLLPTGSKKKFWLVCFLCDRWKVIWKKRDRERGREKRFFYAGSGSVLTGVWLITALSGLSANTYLASMFIYMPHVPFFHLDLETKVQDFMQWKGLYSCAVRYY